jgi:hypothetical protein
MGEVSIDQTQKEDNDLIRVYIYDYDQVPTQEMYQSQIIG